MRPHDSIESGALFAFLFRLLIAELPRNPSRPIHPESNLS